MTDSFDYDRLEVEARIVARRAAADVRSLAGRTAQTVVEIGQRLAEVRQLLAPAGHWEAWLAAEFGWADQTARRFLHVAERYGAEKHLSAYAPSALYLLAAPSTPDAARVEAASLAAGGPVSHAAARQIVGRHRGAVDALAALPAELRAEAIALASVAPAQLPTAQMGGIGTMPRPADGRRQRIDRGLHLLDRARQLFEGLGGEGEDVLGHIERARAAAAAL